jgi:AraC family transcriptional regulator, transcriptional activator of pobA
MMERLFHIFRADEQDAEKVALSKNEPHFHDFEELIIGVEGILEHFIDFKTTSIETPFASFITKGKIHRIKPLSKNGRCDMWIIRFKSEFIPETTFQLYASYHESANIKLTSSECARRLFVLCEMIFTEIQQEIPDYSVIRHLLSATFTMIESERRKGMPEDVIAQNSINKTFRSFLTILEENYRRPEGVDFYAEKLFMSSRNLNLICQKILQQSVSEIIETRKLIEAKNLLINSDITIAEIGFQLGYQDKAYFTSVFKKKSGQTPTEFKEEMRRLVS